MLELLFFLFIIPSKIRPLAKLRGEPSIRWILKSWGAWITMEVGVGFLVLLVHLAVTSTTSWAQHPIAQLVLFAGYFAAVLLGMNAADKVRHKLESLPILSLDKQPTRDVTE